MGDRQAPPTGLPPALVLAGVALSGTSIAALLAELYGVADMATFGRFVTVPGLLALAVLGGSRAIGGDRGVELRRRLRVGAIAGVAGTLAYDVVRIPFVLGGRRLLAPIDSYGLLLTGRAMSSSLSDCVGWLFHLSNGVTFGTAYALVMARRHWAWGIAWGLLLETAIVVSPFRERYNLSDWTAIGIAYGAHIPYGYAVGRMAQRLDELDRDLRRAFRAPAMTAVLATALAVVAWQHPWRDSESRRAAEALSETLGQPVAVVESDAFSPEWLRVEPGGCIHVENRGSHRFETKFGTVEPDAGSQLCFPDEGIVRVRLGSRAYSGGFVDVES